VWSSLLVLFLAAAPAAAEPAAGPPDVVRAQIDAFKRGDFTAAYAFASAGIQRIYDRHSWEQMVRSGYPEIAEPIAMRVLEDFEGSDGTYERVRVIGRNGKVVEAIYKLVQEEGVWKVDGVITHGGSDMI